VKAARDLLQLSEYGVDLFLEALQTRMRFRAGLQQLFNGDRQRSDASAGGVVHGVGDGG
jgi:hypothetical protein